MQKRDAFEISSDIVSENQLQNQRFPVLWNCVFLCSCIIVFFGKIKQHKMQIWKLHQATPKYASTLIKHQGKVGK